LQASKSSGIKGAFDTWFLYGILGISSLLIFLIAFGAVNIQSAYALPLILIFGVIDVFIVLTIAGKIFVNIDYGCREEALGLPEGSVRALIALSLIIIFAIMAIYMFNSLIPQNNIFLVKAGQTFIFPNGSSTTPTIDTFVFLEPSQAQRDFSSQTLTTVSTLVVALAGFYFGTKAVSTAKGTPEEKEKLTIQSASISSTPSLTLLVQSSVGATIGGIFIKDASGKTIGTFDASDVVPNDGKLITVTSTSWKPEGTETIKKGSSYTATIATTKGDQITSAPTTAT
jgi:hypothetical protein